jgi:hypothetical protein
MKHLVIQIKDNNMIILEQIILKCSFNNKEEILMILIWEDSEDSDFSNKEEDNLEDLGIMILLLKEQNKYLEICSMNCNMIIDYK